MFQWGHDITVVETLVKEYYQKGEISFNGATTLQSWKQEPVLLIYLSELKFQWGHDITVVETLMNGKEENQSGSFNGATTLQSWKLGQLV